MLTFFGHFVQKLGKIYQFSGHTGLEFIKALNLLNDFQKYLGNHVAPYAHCSILITTKHVALKDHFLKNVYYQYEIELKISL
jgi:hypothetical protein